MRKHQARGIGVLRLCLVGVILGVLDFSPAAHAQYFGRNKVEYADFDFRILTTEHFDVYYYEREARAARIAAQLAERWYARLSRVLQHGLDRRQPLIVYGSQAEFAQTNVVSGSVPDSVGGVTESRRRRIVMPFAPTMAETDRVLGHELVHAFQFDIAHRYGGGTAQPLWFVEGMAEYLARGTADVEAALWLRDVVQSDRLPHKQSDAARQLSPYQYGYTFWSYLGNRFGDQVVEKALKPDKRHRPLNARMQYATGLDLETLHTDWRKHVYARYGATPGTSRVELWNRQGMQIGPSLSPDGKRAAFFSERDRVSLDLFLADVKSGTVVRRLATTAASGRFDSLQSLRSAGAWSPEGDIFAFPAVRQGRATLTLVAINDDRRDRELVFEQLGQILSPTWSPDGKSIAFSALTGGFTDLYVYDLATRTLHQLTDDAPADLQPAWSHDGKRIAFVTERYSSDVTELRFGRPQLALLDVATHTVRQVDVGESRGQLNPQWARDDEALYYVGDTDGATNIFRVGLASSAVEQLTSVRTGVGGVTPTSPALSVAAAAPLVAYTVYERGRPQLVVFSADKIVARHRVAPPSTPAAERARATEAQAEEFVATRGLVDRLRADHQTGLPNPETLGTRDYSSRMSLETLGQAFLNSGGGPFDTFVRAGGAIMFGDMLGQRRKGAALQIGNQLRNATFEFRFLNQQRRWNWGTVAELQPRIRRYRRSDAIERDGDAAFLRPTDYLQRMQVRAAGLFAYPFNRGLRLELTAGMRHENYHRERRSPISTPTTGSILSTERTSVSAGDPATVGEVTAAIVHDTTAFGITGPLIGSRYRFEIAPAMGNLTFTRVVADYRRYTMPVRPYTMAVRLLHAARYGPDGDDPRLMSSDLGSNSLVRGYRLDVRHCAPDLTCVGGDELLGSRVLVGNVELRFPTWRLWSRQSDYGRIPADVFLFADSGLVWSGPPPAGFAVGRHSNGIMSIGGGVRVNAGGLPFEITAIRALDDARPGWQTDFGFRVGF